MTAQTATSRMENPATSGTVAAFTETTSCSICGSTSYSVLVPSQYPKGLTVDEILRVYSSSSDSQLMDQLVECTNCRLAYLNPRVRGDLILESYRGAATQAPSCLGPSKDSEGYPSTQQGE